LDGGWSPWHDRTSIRRSSGSGRLVFEWRETRSVTTGGVNDVAAQLGVNPETLRNWLKRVEIDTGLRPGTTTADQERINQLEQENRELRRANEILKRASAFFAFM
jgi:transposase